MSLSIRGVKSHPELFHNEMVRVYSKNVRLEDIEFWKENARTLLAFDVLEAASKRSISELSLDEVTKALAKRPELQLSKLASSIGRNGVRVPLIAIRDGTLLDGNRRFFAASLLRLRANEAGEERPEVLDRIPAWIIRTQDANKRVQDKIIAEANFVRDLKVPWPLDVQAKVLTDYFQQRRKNGLKPDAIYEEIKDVYGEDRSKVDAFLETVELSKDFLASASVEKKNRYREIVQGKFLYFWEFRNKAMKGTSALDEKTELPKVKALFFKMIELGRFDNFKQVEPMIRSVRDEDAWELLRDSKGTKIGQVEAIIQEKRALRSVDDKARSLLRWVRGLTKKSLSTSTLKCLGEISVEINRLTK